MNQYCKRNTAGGRAGMFLVVVLIALAMLAIGLAGNVYAASAAPAISKITHKSDSSDQYDQIDINDATYLKAISGVTVNGKEYVEVSYGYYVNSYSDRWYTDSYSNYLKISNKETEYPAIVVIEASGYDDLAISLQENGEYAILKDDYSGNNVASNVTAIEVTVGWGEGDHSGEEATIGLYTEGKYNPIETAKATQAASTVKFDGLKSDKKYLVKQIAVEKNGADITGAYEVNISAPTVEEKTNTESRWDKKSFGDVESGKTYAFLTSSYGSTYGSPGKYDKDYMLSVANNGPVLTEKAQWETLSANCKWTVEGSTNKWVMQNNETKGYLNLSESMISVVNQKSSATEFVIDDDGSIWTGSYMIHSNPTPTITCSGYYYCEFTPYEFVESGSKYYQATYTVNNTSNGKWMVVFDSNGGSSVETQYVDASGKASKPEDPQKGAYEFAGWYSDESCSNAFDFESEITGDITLYAKWVAQMAPSPASVTKAGYYSSYDALEYASTCHAYLNAVTVLTVDGQKYTKSDSSTPSNGCWYLGQDYVDNGYKNTKIRINNSGMKYPRVIKISADGYEDAEFTIKDDGTIEASAYTVTFDLNGGTGAVKAQKVSAGNQVTKPNEDPTREGYHFKGWQLNGKAYDFETTVNAAMTLKAAWAQDAPMPQTDVYKDTDKIDKLIYDDACAKYLEAVTAVSVGGRTYTKETSGSSSYVANYNNHYFSNASSYSSDYAIYLSNSETEYPAEVKITATEYEDVTFWITTVGKISKDRPNDATKYTVTFETNGGSSITPRQIEAGKKITELDAPTKDHYDFAGWYRDEKLSTSWNLENDTVTGELKLYAKWTPEAYTVTFDSDGGSEITPQTVEYNKVASKPSNDPTKEGFVFIGWAVKKDNQAAGDYDFDSPVTGHLALIAKWTNLPTPVPKNVTMDAAGLDTAEYTSDASDYIEKITAVTVNENTFKQDDTGTSASLKGYSNRWMKDKSRATLYLSNKDTAYPARVTVKATGYTDADFMIDAAGKVTDVTKLTNVKTVSFVTNGDNKAGAQAIADNGKAVPPTGLKKAETDEEIYSIEGWYQNSDFSTGSKYDFEKPVTDNITLYAKWIATSKEKQDAPKPQKGDVGRPSGSDRFTYKAADAAYVAKISQIQIKGADADEATVYDQKVNSESAAGTTSKGFYIQNGQNNEIYVAVRNGYKYPAIVTVKAGGFQDLTFKVTQAGWILEENDPDSYAVTFDPNGHGTAPEAQKVSVGSTAKEPTKPTAEGYAFGGWYTDQKCSESKKFNFHSTAIDSAVTLYAKWNVENYSLEYDLDGGTVAKENPAAYTVETEPFTLSNPTKTNYVFAGWKLDGENETAEPVQTITIAKGSTGDRKYKAIWNEQTAETGKVLVKFDTDGGSVIENQQVTKGEKASRPADPTKEGFVFKGWTLNDIPFDFNTEIEAEIVLKAMWEESVSLKQAPDPSKIDINASRGSDEIEFTNTDFVEKISSVKVGEDDYTFTSVANEEQRLEKRYFKAANPNGRSYVAIRNNGYTYPVTVTIQATGYTDLTVQIASNGTGENISENETFTVAFDANGHGTAPAAQDNVTKGSKVNVPAAPEAEGYIFGGWFKDQACEQAWDFGQDTVTQNTTLYAKWISAEQTYTVTFETDGGTAVAAASVKHGQKASTPSEPTKEGYSFKGWYSDETLITAYDFEAPVTANVTLYAKWEENKSNSDNTGGNTGGGTGGGAGTGDSTSVGSGTGGGSGTAGGTGGGAGTGGGSGTGGTTPATDMRTVLNTSIKEAKAVASADYTAESYQALEKAIANAEKLVADQNATNQQLKDAVDAITAARSALVKASDVPTTPATPDTPAVQPGDAVTVNGQEYRVLTAGADAANGTVTLNKAKNGKSVTIPNTVKLSDGKIYKVAAVSSGAFAGSKATKVTVGKNVKKLSKDAFNKSKVKTLVVKTKKLTKASVKGSLKGSKVTTVKVKVGSKKVNKKYVKKYKKIFTKKIAGKKVRVK